VQQYQSLADILKQHSNGATTSQALVNQVGSFTVNSPPKAAEQSPTGNVYALNDLQNAKNYWLIDSGATDHVCISLSEYFSYKSIKPIQISLPNGHHVFSQFSGTIIFNDKLHLTDV